MRKQKIKIEKKRSSATIEFADDFGDNPCTFHCQREEGHEGEHFEEGDMGSKSYPMPYRLVWRGNWEEYIKILKEKYEDEEDNR